MPKTTEEQLKELRAKRQAEREIRERQKKGWYGLVHCGEYASISTESSKPIWLGKSSEVVPYLKQNNVDGENLMTVLSVMEGFSERKTDPPERPEMPLRASKLTSKRVVCRDNQKSKRQS